MAAGSGGSWSRRRSATPVAHLLLQTRHSGCHRQAAILGLEGTAVSGVVRCVGHGTALHGPQSNLPGATQVSMHAATPTFTPT